MKKIFITAVALFTLFAVSADEGMWPVQTLNTIAQQMRARGLKIKDNEIFNAATPALCDAVVAVDGGMGTGSIISAEGLMITNHHVAYSDICALSTPEHNYLDDGFWAASRKDEIPIKGKSVTFLRKVIDVTAEAQTLIAEMKASGKWGPMSMRKLVSVLESRYAKNEWGYEPCCVNYWQTEKFYMALNEVYKDVRLVAAPPARIGAFGGDTDNWGWPQHKGDFTIYRVYGSAEGKPADYSPSNVPLRPRKYLKVATSGVVRDDYAMVIGYPFKTSRYLSSGAVRERRTVTNPVVVERRQARMEIMRGYMNADNAVRLNYSDAFFNLANYADFAKWETICLRRDGVESVRQTEEQRLQQWIDADAARKARYGNLVERLANGYKARAEAQRAKIYYREAWFTPSRLLIMGMRVNAAMRSAKNGTVEPQSLTATKVLAFKDYMLASDASVECDVFADAFRSFTANVGREYWGEAIAEVFDRFGGDADKVADYVMQNSYCASWQRFEEYFSQSHTVADVASDVVCRLAASAKYSEISKAVDAAEQSVSVDVSNDERLYATAIYEFRNAEGRVQYPNANSSMRLTYGCVLPLTPRDGIEYDYLSTVGGYIEKADTANRDFNVDARMHELIEARQWGCWGDKDGRLWVDFITDNDIIGGNSGSPVLNGKGNLVGLAFDGNRESMSCDAYYRSDKNRCVCVDIRFVMWVIEKYAGRGDLLAEIEYVK